MTSLFTGSAEKTKTVKTSEQTGDYSKTIQTTEGQHSPAVTGVPGEVTIEFDKVPIEKDTDRNGTQ